MEKTPIGYWQSKSEPQYPIPVANSATEEEIVFMLKMLDKIEKQGHKRFYKGSSTCRLCNQGMGSGEYEYKGYLVPEGLRSYASVTPVGFYVGNGLVAALADEPTTIPWQTTPSLLATAYPNWDSNVFDGAATDSIVGTQSEANAACKTAHSPEWRLPTMGEVIAMRPLAGTIGLFNRRIVTINETDANYVWSFNPVANSPYSLSKQNEYARRCIRAIN